MVISLSACAGNETATDTDTGSSATQSQSVPTESSKPTTTTKPETTKPSTPTHTHSYSGATCTAPAKCSCGETSGSALGHSYSNATCTEAKKCTRCGATNGSALGHSYSNATCTEAKKCTRCGATNGSALDHSYSNATCTEAKKCSRCGVTSGSALGHSYSNATCTEAKKCSRCGVTSGSALGHSYSNGVCSRCGRKDNNYVKPVLVYQDSRVKIYYKQYTNNGVVFEVENLTNVTITIQADTIALNYRSTDNITMSDDVSPYSIGDVVARCSISNVGNIGVISGQLRIIDFNGSFRSYDAKFVNVVVNSSVNVKKPTVSKPLVYSDSKVKIYYKEMNASGVVFTVENLTDVVITIQADSVSINRRSTDNITMSDDVSPHSTGDVVARCSFGSVPTVELVGGQLRIIDFNGSFRSYDATFYNVAV